MIIAAAEFAGIRYTKLQKFSSPLKLKIPQKTSSYEHRRQYVFPEIDAAWRKNQLEQIEEIKSSCRLLELALDGQCDSPSHNGTYNIVSAIVTATNKLIKFRVAYVNVCNYLNETTHYVNFCDFRILHAQSQCHNIKTTLKPTKNCDIDIDTCMFWKKVSAASILHFLEGYCAFNWKTKLYVIYHNVMRALSLEASKIFLLRIFHTARR